MSESVRFFLDIPADRFRAYYQGAAETVYATAVDGRRIRFPARVLRPFLTRGGIQGEFILRYDAQHRFEGIERVGDLPGS